MSSSTKPIVPIPTAAKCCRTVDPSPPTPTRSIFAFVGGFLYKVIQDFSISFFISYGYSVAIGVVLPSFIILIMSTYLYKKI